MLSSCHPHCRNTVLPALLCCALLLISVTSAAALEPDQRDSGAATGGQQYKQDDLCVYEAPAGDPQIIGVYLSHGYWQPMEIEELMAELESLGVNLVIDYALTPPEDSHWRWGFERYLLSAEKHGIGVAFCLGPLLHGMTPDSIDQHFTDVIATVAELKRYPQITAWYVHDEVLPMVTSEGATVDYVISLEQMQELYRLIRAEDSSRPQLNVWSQLPTYRQFGDMFSDSHTPHGRPAWMESQATFEAAMSSMVQRSCDWVLVDSYPVGAQWQDHDQISELAYIEAIVRRANHLRDSHQPVYLVFQAFSWAQYGRADWSDAPFPTFAQMRDMLVTGWRNGATGAIAYSWFDLAKEIDGRDVPGRERCLHELGNVLSRLSRDGWPSDRTRLPYEASSSW